jgi:hypothetical protein
MVTRKLAPALIAGSGKKKGGTRRIAYPLQIRSVATINEPANQTDPIEWTVPPYMNSSVHPPPSAQVRQAYLRLALCLLPGAALSEALSAPPRGATATRPYLTCAAAPLIRFAEAPPLPDLSVRPPAGAPPNPPSPDSAPDPATDVTPAVPNTVQPQPANEPTNRNDAQAPAPVPPRIIPDDTRPAVRPEDFLPFFIFPGSAQGSGNPAVVLPGSLTPAVPGTLPPSTATYRQQ